MQSNCSKKNKTRAASFPCISQPREASPRNSNPNFACDPVALSQTGKGYCNAQATGEAIVN